MIVRLALFIAACVVAGPDEGEPLRDPFFQRRADAVERLVREGAAGLDRARRALESDDHRGRTLALEVLGRAGSAADVAAVQSRATSSDRPTRVAAGESLGRLVERGVVPAEVAFPASVLDAPGIRSGIARRVDRAVLDLVDRKPRVRWGHAVAYRGFVRLGGLAVPSLEAIALDRCRGTEVRCHALVALGRAAGAGALPFLAGRLREARTGDPMIPFAGERPGDLRAAAAAGLSLAGTPTPLAVEELLRATDAYTESVRNYGNWGLAVVAEELPEESRRRLASECVRQLGEDDSPAVLSLIALALQFTGTPDDARALIEKLHERPRFVDYYLLDAVWSLASGREEALVEMRRQLDSPNPAARGYAHFALGIEPDAELVAALRELLVRNTTTLPDDVGFGVRTACLALGLLGAQSAVDDLLAKTRDASDDVRTSAAAALGFLDGTEDTQAALRDLLADRYEYASLYASESLYRLGDTDAVEGFVLGLASGNRFVMRRSLQVLASILDGETFGFRLDAPGDERAKASARWRTWWQEHRDSLRFDPESGSFRLP